MNWLDLSETEILDIANPIMDNLMQASTEVDHERHVKDFTEQLKAIVTKENLEAQCKDYQAELGYFAEREFVAVFRKETDASIFWKQKYTLSTGEHIAFLRLISVNGRIRVQNVSRVQIRSAILNNRLGGRDGIASEPLDRQVKVAKNELHPSHPRRTIPNFHSAQGRT